MRDEKERATRQFLPSDLLQALGTTLARYSSRSHESGSCPLSQLAGPASWHGHPAPGTDTRPLARTPGPWHGHLAPGTDTRPLARTPEPH